MKTLSNGGGPDEQEGAAPDQVPFAVQVLVESLIHIRSHMNMSNLYYSSRVVLLISMNQEHLLALRMSQLIIKLKQTCQYEENYRYKSFISIWMAQC